ncbi:MAG: peptidase S8 [Elusimicrobia bacterium CG08_land_8_20_14_0_20_59_10]|nr:MAG: peptidase S8 [Elusimicrobia bacterium CG08_land_8_20_14_0_20_59_10]
MRKMTTILAGALLMLAAHAQAAQKVISFEAAYRDGAIVKSVESIGGKVLRQFKLIDALSAVFPDNIKDAAIYSLEGVTGVEEDKYINWLESTELSMNSVPLPGLKSAMSTINAGLELPLPVSRTDDPEIPWGIERVNAAGAWNFTEGAGIKVAVIDTGVDYTHPDLKGNYAGGYNTILTTQTPMDDHGHGTHVSGTIAAVKNASGVVGVAPRALIYGVKVLDRNGSGSYSNVMAGIEWAALNKMDVINMSLGGGGAMEAMQKIMTAAHEAGVTIVCAAGNDSGAVNYPAKYPESIAVSASDSSDRLAYFSSRGPEIAVIAPGVNIYSARLGGGYRTMSGTSMSCPHVAGLAALAIGAGAGTPDEVREKLTGAAVLLPGLKPTDQGAGLVNAANLR